MTATGAWVGVVVPNLARQELSNVLSEVDNEAVYRAALEAWWTNGTIPLGGPNVFGKMSFWDVAFVPVSVSQTVASVPAPCSVPVYTSTFTWRTSAATRLPNSVLVQLHEELLNLGV